MIRSRGMFYALVTAVTSAAGGLCEARSVGRARLFVGRVPHNQKVTGAKQ